MEACRELLALEPDVTKCKWPLLTLARLYRLQAAATGQAQQLQAESRALYEQLIEADPKRAGYYRDELAGRASVGLRT